MACPSDLTQFDPAEATGGGDPRPPAREAQGATLVVPSMVMGRWMVVVAVVAVSFSCARGPDGWPGRNGAQMRAQASRDLDCPSNQLSQEKVDHYIHRADGCGRSQVYIYNRATDMWTKHEDPRTAHRAQARPKRQPSTCRWRADCDAEHWCVDRVCVLKEVAFPAPPGGWPKERLKINATADGGAELTTSRVDEDGNRRVVFWLRGFKDGSGIVFTRCKSGPGLMFVKEWESLRPSLVAGKGELCDVDISQLGITRMLAGEPAELLRERISGGNCCRICRIGNACGDSCVSADNECHQESGCAC